MQLPQRIPGLKVVTALVAVYGVVWIALEGALWRALLLALGASSVLWGQALQQMGGRRFSRGGWLLFSGFVGSGLGVSSVVLALLAMGVKTGLHAHGPEFGAAEIGWVVAQLPWWTAGGLVGGVGMGLILLGVGESD